MRELLILRHGKSDWDAGTDDFHRPLTRRGIRGAQQIGIWLAQAGLKPDLVLSSPAERAIKTAEFTFNSLGLGAQGIQAEDRLYFADLEQLLAILGDCPAAARCVMLVGHNPGLETLLEYLSADTPQTEDAKLLPTATVARLQMPEDWQALQKGCARLCALIRPAMLPKKFPYPDAQGAELREQPAYYYRQAAALPYRIKDNGKVEVLIVRSNKGKRWIIPKGIQLPGYSARETAAIEAREEAGVEGEIAEAPLMQYQYKKWGGMCTVQVFSMQVLRLIPQEQWEESHRGRKWVSAESATKYIDQEALRAVFAAFAEQRENH